MHLFKNQAKCKVQCVDGLHIVKNCQGSQHPDFQEAQVDTPTTLSQKLLVNYKVFRALTFEQYDKLLSLSFKQPLYLQLIKFDFRSRSIQILKFSPKNEAFGGKLPHLGHFSEFNMILIEALLAAAVGGGRGGCAAAGGYDIQIVLSPPNSNIATATITHTITTPESYQNMSSKEQTSSMKLEISTKNERETLNALRGSRNKGQARQIRPKHVNNKYQYKLSEKFSLMDRSGHQVLLGDMTKEKSYEHQLLIEKPSVVLPQKRDASTLQPIEVRCKKRLRKIDQTLSLNQTETENEIEQQLNDQIEIPISNQEVSIPSISQDILENTKTKDVDLVPDQASQIPESQKRMRITRKAIECFWQNKLSYDSQIHFQKRIQNIIENDNGLTEEMIEQYYQSQVHLQIEKAQKTIGWISMAAMMKEPDKMIEAISYRYDYFKEHFIEDFKSALKLFVTSHLKKSFKSHTEDWSYLSSKHLKVLSKVFLESEVEIPAQQLKHALEVQEDLLKDFNFQQLYLFVERQGLESREIIIQHVYNFSRAKSNLLATKFQEYFDEEIIKYFESVDTIGSNHLQVLSSFDNIKQNMSKVQTIFEWLSHKPVADCLESISTHVRIDYERISLQLERLNQRLRKLDKQQSKKLQDRIGRLTSISALTQELDAEEFVKETFGGAAVQVKEALLQNINKDLENKFKKIYNSVETLNLISQYLEVKKKLLFDWQVASASMIASCLQHQQNLGFMSLPVGTGKSLIISFASMLLSREIQKKVIIVCSNQYLKQQSFVKFGNQNISQAYPFGLELDEESKVIYACYSEILKHDFKGREKDYYLMIDEFDLLLNQEFCTFRTTHFQKDKKHGVTFFHMPSFLRKFQGCFGVSATATRVTLLKMKNTRCDTLPVFRLNPRTKDQSSFIRKRLEFTDNENKIIQVIEDAQNALAEGRHVIIIDDRISQNKMKYNNNLQCDKICLENFSHNSSYSKTVTKLGSLAKATTPVCIMTNLVGARGVDYELQGGVHVIIALEYLDYISYTQAIGRGARGVDKHATATLLISQEQSDIPLQGIEEHLLQLHNLTCADVQTKNAILKCINDYTMRQDTKHTKNILEIFNGDASIYHAKNDKQDKAYRNWVYIKEQFKNVLGQYKDLDTLLAT